MYVVGCLLLMGRIVVVFEDVCLKTRDRWGKFRDWQVKRGEAHRPGTRTLSTLISFALYMIGEYTIFGHRCIVVDS
jgi:hypothetical protein